MSSREEPTRRLPGRSAAPAQRPGLELALLFVAVLVAIGHLAQLLDFGYGRDQGIYAVVADVVREGGAPYLDAWDFKPPGIHFVFALAEGIAGPSSSAIRWLEAAALASLFPAFAVLSRRALGSARAGIAGAAVAIASYVPLEYWNTAQPEGFGGVVLAWALVLATAERADADPRDPVLAWGGAAALYAMAGLLKPPLGGGIAVSFAAVCAARWRAADPGARWASLRAPALAFGLGGALPVVAVLGFFAAHGALGALYEALFLFTSGYVALDLSADRLPMLAAVAAERWLFEMTPLLPLGLTPLLLLPAIHPNERRGTAHVLGVVAVSLLGVALQGKFFAYHFGATILLTGLLAGWGFWKVWDIARESKVGVVAAALLLPLLWVTALPGKGATHRFWERSERRMASWLDPGLVDETRDALYAEGDVDSRDNRAAAAWITEHTPASSTLYVWGHQPVLYDLAARRPASRYIYNVPQRAPWSRDRMRPLLLRDLTDTVPAAVIVIHGDEPVFSTVMREPVSSAHALRSFPDLEQWLADHYTFARRIGDLEIFVRRST